MLAEMEKIYCWRSQPHLHDKGHLCWNISVYSQSLLCVYRKASNHYTIKLYTAYHIQPSPCSSTTSQQLCLLLAVLWEPKV
jgi:hypothetical protein